ncbi:MAG: hypothetical protein WCJ30_19270 [Deltaproteobacteria bacterium]
MRIENGASNVRLEIGRLIAAATLAGSVFTGATVFATSAATTYTPRRPQHLVSAAADSVTLGLLGDARRELEHAGGLLSIAGGVRDPAMSRYLNALGAAITMAPDFQRPAAVTNLVVALRSSRVALLDQLKDFATWRAAVAVLQPEAASVRVPARFIRAAPPRLDEDIIGRARMAVAASNLIMAG